MPTAISRDEVRRLLAAGAQLIEVMPADEYAQAHIEGAASLPLEALDAKSAERLDLSRPVITYCFDFQ
jgi:rhodanese-related sulfurtransferase